MAVLDVTDYGATGDGTTDAAAAIQAALDAATTGDVVFVPAGDYRIGAALVMGTDGVTLAGVGPSSILRLMDGVKKTAIALPWLGVGELDPALIVSDVTISDLTVDGNFNAGAEFGVEPDYYAIFIRQAEGVTLARLTVKRWASDGISIGNGNRPVLGLTVEDCLITGIHRNGIHVGFAAGAIIRRNFITDTPTQHYGPSAAHSIDVEVEGYDFYGGTPFYPYVRNLTIEDNILHREDAATASNGVALQPAYGPLSGVIVRRNLISGHQLAIETTGALGLYGEAAGAHDVTVEDNWMTAVAGHAVSGYPMAFSGASGVTVRRNVINVGSGGGNFSNGPAVAINGSEFVTFDGHTIRMDPAGPNKVAHLSNGAAHVAITDNDYQTNGATVVTDDGTATDVTITGNVDISGTAWDTTPPSIDGFSVSEGATISAPTDVTVTASDAGSAVARVYFFADGLPAGHSDAAPHAFAFDPGAHTVGAHTLSAMAVDSAANFGPGEAVGVTVAAGGPAPPILMLAVPGGLALYNLGAS
jgi:hypothetical protein